VADDKLRLPRRVSRFVLTVGATANQNGTALFEGVTVLFLAQYFGIELTLAQQVTVMFVCILGGIGTAGVPSGSLPVIALICAMVGVPPEGIGLVLGVNLRHLSPRPRVLPEPCADGHAVHARGRRLGLRLRASRHPRGRQRPPHHLAHGRPPGRRTRWRIER
jgi:hypothetical protein